MKNFMIHPVFIFILAFIIIVLSVAMVFVLRHASKISEQAQLHSGEHSDKCQSFLVNVSHELRTPLTLIMGPLEKVLDSMSSSDMNYRRIESSYKQAKHMRTLLETVLNASSTDHPASLNTSLQSFNNWVKNVVADFESEASERGINFKVEYSAHINMVEFDDEKCQVVLSNLILNALNHNPDNSEIHIWTEAHPERASVRVAVSDRGTKIKESDIDKLFNLVYQQTEENHGFGVGLSYSKKIIDDMHGLMSAYNNSFGGCTFYFEIPANIEEPHQAPAPQSGPITEGFDNIPKFVNPNQSKDVVVDPAMVPFDELKNVPDIIIDLKSANLLVVEDDEDLLRYLKEEFSQYLKNVYTATNGMEAVSVLSKQDINVIVSDIMMPVMDGYALCRYVKTTVSISHIPIILLTARSDENSRILGYKNGADDYITKPFDLEALKDSIQKLFFSREAVRRRFVSDEPMPSAAECTFSSADEQFLSKFEKLVSDNISKPELDTKFLVDNMSMSRTVLFNKVKQLTGMNIQNYVNKVRMEYVINLMNTTSLPLGEIAEKSGFSSPRYFSTSFKNYTGVTPTQYKKDHR